MRRGRTIVVAGGGTGGHVYPVLEILRALHAQDPALEFVYIGQHSGPEREVVQTAKLPVPLPFIGVTAEKLRRYWHWRLFILPFAVLLGTMQALKVLASIRPAAVLCKGGYVGVPVAIAAWLLRIPIVLHETDAVMGLANRLIAPFAARIAVSFRRPNLRRRRGQKIVYTGNPVHPDFFTVKRHKEHEHPYLLITGGSLGSVAINSLVLPILPQLTTRYHVTHLTGRTDFGRVRAAFQHREYFPTAYADDMVTALGEADLVVSRAGGTIFEMAALGKPAIFIPLLRAANNHQRANAEILQGQAAGVLLDQATLTPAKLLATITSLMRDSRRRAELAHNIRQFARPDAAEQIAGLVLEVARKHS